MKLDFAAVIPPANMTPTSQILTGLQQQHFLAHGSEGLTASGCEARSGMFHMSLILGPSLHTQALVLADGRTARVLEVTCHISQSLSLETVHCPFCPPLLPKGMSSLMSAGEK